MYPGVGPEGWLGGFAHPLGGAVCRGPAQYPAFAPDTLFLLPAPQKCQLCFWSLCILLFIICPNCACTQLFLVPYSFFVFCCLRRRVFGRKQCSKGPQVTACLKRCSKGFQVPGPRLSQEESQRMHCDSGRITLQAQLPLGLSFPMACALTRLVKSSILTWSPGSSSISC